MFSGMDERQRHILALRGALPLLFIVPLLLFFLPLGLGFRDFTNFMIVLAVFFVASYGVLRAFPSRKIRMSGQALARDPSFRMRSVVGCMISILAGAPFIVAMIYFTASPSSGFYPSIWGAIVGAALAAASAGILVYLCNEILYLPIENSKPSGFQPPFLITLSLLCVSRILYEAKAHPIVEVVTATLAMFGIPYVGFLVAQWVYNRLVPDGRVEVSF